MQKYYLYVCPKNAYFQKHNKSNKLNHLLISYSIFYMDKQVSYLHILYV